MSINTSPPSAQVSMADLMSLPPQQLAAMAMEEKQAELGRVRAAELKDNSQAYLNMAMAAGKANGPQMDWINAQLRIMELHIEATNTQVRAADVEAKHRLTHLKINADQTRKDVADTGDNISAMPPPSALPPFPPMPPGPVTPPAPAPPAAPGPAGPGLPPLPGNGLARLPGALPPGPSSGLPQ